MPVAAETITIRFPSGAWEYAVTERVPELGDTLVREGETWNVALVAESVDDHRVVIMALPPEVEKEPSHLKKTRRDGLRGVRKPWDPFSGAGRG
jgi:hypothetical protein